MSDESSNSDPNIYSVLMTGITKSFPGVVANRDVSLPVRKGTFHAVIGENGAGKSTLLNILYGRYRPDAGQVWIEGKEVTRTLGSPADAIRLGIGLVSQHYALIPALTVIENVMLGAEGSAPGGILRPRQAAERIRELATRLGLDALDLNSRADRLSVASQQKIEILKALYRGARILLLDEPTATLAPQEVAALFALLHALVEQGTTIVFVTHKLRDVMAHSDEVTILRAGQVQGCYPTREVTEADLLRLMIGERPGITGTGGEIAELEVEPPLSETAVISDAISDLSDSGATGNSESIPDPISKGRGAPVPTRQVAALLDILGATVRNQRGGDALRNLSLTVAKGEIVGIAGVDGSGQRELSEAVVGLRRLDRGQILLRGETGHADITRWSVRQRQDAGIAYIPEDRHRAGMILDFSIAENYLLGHENAPLWGGGPIIDRATLLSRAEIMVRRYDVRGGTLGGTARGGALSGGNQQKMVFARAMDSDPSLLVACQPTRGLDVEAAGFVYSTLREAQKAGMGILLFSLDLDEILLLSDRIVVMFDGAIAGILERAEATPERIGALMTGAITISSKKEQKQDTVERRQG